MPLMLFGRLASELAERGRPEWRTGATVGAFVDDVSSAGTQAELKAILADITKELGFAHFAVSHHVDLSDSSEPAIRIHNYPDEWERYHDGK